MGTAKRPFLCPIVLLGLLTLGFHLYGFIAPRWLVLKRENVPVYTLQRDVITEGEIVEEEMVGGQKIDNGGLPPPKDEPTMMARSAGMDDDDRPHPHPGPHPRPDPHPQPDPRHHGHHGGRHGPHDHEEPMPREEEEEEARLQMWMEEQRITQMASVDVKIKYGLWHSLMCFKNYEVITEIDDEFIEEDADVRLKRDDSSSSDDDDDKHGKRCHCKKVSTACALHHMDIFTNWNVYGYGRRHHHFLTSLRVEASISLGLICVGLLAGVVAFGKVNGSKVAAGLCMLFMFLGAILITLPTARVAHFNTQTKYLLDDTERHIPCSVIMSGLAALFALITAIVSAFGMCKKRREAPGHWYQFNNETMGDVSKDKKPALVFHAEPLPEKAGLYDVCDFSGVKSNEEEPEKKPLE